MPIFWKVFILIVTIYLYNSFSAYHVNKWNDKNHKPFKENNVKMNFEAKGSKRAMHDWQHQKILDYKNSNGGARPPLNKSDW